MRPLKIWNDIRSKAPFRQVMWLFASYLGLIVLGFALKYEQTHLLDEAMYGRYALVISVTGILAIIFRFGYFISLQVLLAKNVNSERERKLLGAGFMAALACGLGLSLSTWLMSDAISAFFHEDVGGLLRSLSPLFAVIPMSSLLVAYGSGTNKVWVNMLVNLIPKSLFLLTLLAWPMYGDTIGVSTLLYMNFFSTIAAFIALLIYLRPDFSKLGKSLGLLTKKTRSFGLKYYSGAIVNQTTYRLDEVCIGYFINAGALGIYSLANMVCSPMLLMSQSLSTSLFKRFSGSKRIPAKVFLYNTIWLLGSVLFFLMSGQLIVQLLFSSDFSEVAHYLVPISLVLLVHGSAAPFSFLVAKSMAHIIRNIAWAEAVVNIAGNLLLIPMYGIMGAIIASFLAKSLNLLMFIYYYRKYLAVG